MIKRNAIRCNHDAGSIFSKLAMNEYCLARRIANELKKMDEIGITGGGKSADRNPFKVHAEGFHAFSLFVGGLRKFRAEVDNSIDAEFFQFGKIIETGLRTAIKTIIDLAGVMNTGNRDFFAGSGNGSSLANVDRGAEAKEIVPKRIQAKIREESRIESCAKRV